MPFDRFLKEAGDARRLTHVVITRGGCISSVQRVNMGLRQGRGGTDAPVVLGALGHRDFTVAREDDIMFDVIGRMTRRKASIAVIVRGHRRVPTTWSASSPKSTSPTRRRCHQGLPTGRVGPAGHRGKLPPTEAL